MGGGGRYPLEQRIENKKRGIGRQRHAFVGALFCVCVIYWIIERESTVWILALTMVGVFINELVVNDKQQGSPVSFKVRSHSVYKEVILIYLQPVVNYMLGPASSVLIDVGARFPPCMKYVADVPPTTLIGCKSLSY